MSTLNVVLSEETDCFIAAGIEAGRYGSAGDAVLEGLRLLEQREADERAEVEWLLAEAQVGIDAMERGEYVTLKSPEEIRQHLSGLMAAIEVSRS